jgi:4-hydroxy-tetrahydrodipicolinate reductase
MTEYEIIFSKRKTLSLQVNADGKVIVRAPLRTGKKYIEDFVAEHEEWIARAKAKVENKKYSLKEASTEEEKALIFSAAEEIPVFYAGNVSLGIAVLCRLVKQAASFFPDAEIEIVEVHHTRKVDAPSGTAHMLFNAIKEVRPNAYENCGRAGEGKRTKDEIGVHALRMGNVVGIHEVHINTGNQTLTLKHESGSRAMLADGAVAAARFMEGKAAGLYDMESILG